MYSDSGDAVAGETIAKVLRQHGINATFADGRLTVTIDGNPRVFRPADGKAFRRKPVVAIAIRACIEPHEFYHPPTEH